MNKLHYFYFLDLKHRPLQSAPVIPVPQNSAWLDLLFPAHVQNPERAMSYLTSEITEKTKDVELKLRPDNPSCIPLRTCVQPAVKLILKLVVSRLKIILVFRQFNQSGRISLYFDIFSIAVD